MLLQATADGVDLLELLDCARQEFLDVGHVAKTFDWLIALTTEKYLDKHHLYWTDNYTFKNLCEVSRWFLTRGEHLRRTTCGPRIGMALVLFENKAEVAHSLAYSTDLPGTIA